MAVLTYQHHVVILGQRDDIDPGRILQDVVRGNNAPIRELAGIGPQRQPAVLDDILRLQELPIEWVRHDDLLLQ